MESQNLAQAHLPNYCTCLFGEKVESGQIPVLQPYSESAHDCQKVWLLSFPSPIILPYALGFDVFEIPLYFLFLSLEDLRFHQDFSNVGFYYHHTLSSSHIQASVFSRFCKPSSSQQLPANLPPATVASGLNRMKRSFSRVGTSSGRILAGRNRH